MMGMVLLLGACGGSNAEKKEYVFVWTSEQATLTDSALWLPAVMRTEEEPCFHLFCFSSTFFVIRKRNTFEFFLLSFIIYITIVHTIFYIKIYCIFRN